MFWKNNLKKENEFLKRLVAAILPQTDVCDICVFNRTEPRDCTLECSDCESEEAKTCACCSCKDNCNFLWNGRSPR